MNPEINRINYAEQQSRRVNTKTAFKFDMNIFTAKNAMAAKKYKTPMAHSRADAGVENADSTIII
jgi:hypothetical protein